MTCLYISDLDRALFCNDARLSQCSLTILQQRIEDGRNFQIASARSVVSMKTLLAGLDLKLPAVEFNGAIVSELNSDRHYIVNAIVPNIAKSIFSDVERMEHTSFLINNWWQKDHLYHCNMINE